MPLNQVDKKALKLLLRYSCVTQMYANSQKPLEPYEQKWIDMFGVTSDEDLAYLKAHGLAFDLVDIAHDDAVTKCFEFYRQCKKSDVTDLFLSSFSTGRPDFRSAFDAYAIMQSMPEHVYVTTTVHDQCDICCAPAIRRDVDLTYMNTVRFKYGTMGILNRPYQIQFRLSQHLQLAHQQPTPRDFEIFNDILDAIRSADAKTKPKDLYKHLKKIAGFKATTGQWNFLVEALGIASILETGKHKGYLTTYTNPGLPPSKSHSSNWPYPVDFWVGADGINRDALAFWFGAYPEIRI